MNFDSLCLSNLNVIQRCRLQRGVKFFCLVLANSDLLAVARKAWGSMGHPGFGLIAPLRKRALQFFLVVCNIFSADAIDSTYFRIRGANRIAQYYHLR
jgi:hypothetical protein